MTCAWVRHKTTNLKLSCTIMTIESGVDVLDKLVREYTCMRSTRHWTLKLCFQTYSACNDQQVLPFKISLLLLHAKNVNCLFHSEISQRLLLKIKPPYEVCKTHAQIWSWTTQTQCTSSQPISLSFQLHTTHYFVNVYYLAISFKLDCRK